LNQEAKVSKVRIITATLLALALAAPAMAFDVSIKGDFNNRFIYTTNSAASKLDVLSSETPKYVNVAPLAANSGLTKEDSSSDDFAGEIKYRLIFAAADDDKKVKGTWGMEIGAEKFGSDGAKFAGDTLQYELMWANVDFELPFDPATRMIIGLQPVGLNKWVWSDNAAGVKLASKRGDLSYGLSWFRNDYTFGTQEDTRDVYALDVAYKGEGLPNLNAFAYYSHDDGKTTTTAGGDVVCEDLNDNGVVDAGECEFSAPSSSTTRDDEQIWLGLAVDGQAGPLFYGATGVYMTGELEANAPGASDLDRKAYLLHGELTYKAGPARIKGGWLYASGDDDPTDNDVENYDVIDVYIPIGSVVIFDSYADDNTASRSPYIRDKGYNMPYISVDYDLNDKTTVGASWFWHMTAEDIEFATDPTDRTTIVAKEDDLGHEIAVRAAHKITKNLTAGIQAGYLIGGDAWDALGTNGDSDDMFVTDASIRLKF
jgi:hypothetical protein